MTTTSPSDDPAGPRGLSGADRVRTRRAIIGAVAGVVPGLVFASVTEPRALGLALGPLLGLLYGLAFRCEVGGALDHAVAAAASSVPAWALVRVIGLELVRNGRPAWTVDGMTALLPVLPAWVIAGALFGTVLPVVSYALETRYGPLSPDESEPEPDVDDRIVVLGGGFAGLSAVQRLEERFGPDPTVELTLVSETNAILFTPLLAEVAGGSIEPAHVTTPLRTSLVRTRVVQGKAVDVDIDDRTVVLEPNEPVGVGSDRVGDGADAGTPIGDGATEGETISYDHLVVALGSVPNYRGLETVREFAFDFKRLGDAIAIRNHVIDCFERADRESNPETREALVTFVVAGAGFAGAELAGALNDFVHGMSVHYPNVPSDEVRVVVAHSRERIMPELSDPLAAYALECMRARGVAFRLGTYVTGADPESGTVTFSSGDPIRTETLIWTAGNRPNPLVESLDVPRAETGGIHVDQSLSVRDREGIWAAGTAPPFPTRLPATTIPGRPNTRFEPVKSSQTMSTRRSPTNRSADSSTGRRERSP